MTSRIIKLGTRRSLLAWAQSGWVAREVERLNPGVTVERVGIETRGDKILDVSLQSVEGKEFFVAELDEALHSGAVDFSVHSMKDLSLDRPPEFCLASVPRRENPRDVILFAPGILDQLEGRLDRGRPIRIGTSSPRRQVNLPPFLERALPVRGGKPPKIELVELRGNVNTRLSRVHEPADSPRHLDAVVLAFAGLIRLWADAAGRAELSRLLEGVRWMVLPLKECPAAPAQGALAVECRTEDASVRALLTRLHDTASARQAALERQLLADWGGGCHQKFGATAFPFGNQELLFVRGLRPDGQAVDEMRWKPPKAAPQGPFWDGSEWRGESEAEDVALPAGAPQLGPGVFVAHWRAARPALVEPLSRARVWVSGTSSWFKLASQGIWVEGSAEGMGFETIERTLAEPVLRLPASDSWTVLTHEGATSDWSAGRAVATYRVAESYPEGAREALRQARSVYWSSGSQFLRLRELAAPGVVHACGPGKTVARLRWQGVEPLVFPSTEEWRKWTQNTRSPQASSRSGG